MKGGKEMKNKWYKVIPEENFYAGMVGRLVETTDKSIKLYFGDDIGEAIFYKYQVIYEDTF